MPLAERLYSAAASVLPARVKSLIRRQAGVAEARPRPYSTDYSYQTGHMNRVPEHGVILDVASGNNPFSKATILSDRFVEPTQHRYLPITRDHRPFLLLDIEHLPFRSKTFDYVYCSHVLEHVEDPLRACAELMRVGKGGYIETPTLMKDVLFSWAEGMHKWHVMRFNNRLVFFEYDQRRLAGVRSPYWRDTVLGEQYHPNQDLFYPNQDVFNTILEWNDRFDVTVFRLDRPEPESLR